jgi:hypothetical protein
MSSYGIISYKDILEELKKDKEEYGGDWVSVLEFYVSGLN